MCKLESKQHHFSLSKTGTAMVILAVPLPPALHIQNQIETLCIPTIHAKQLGNNDCVLLLHIHYTIFVYTSREPQWHNLGNYLTCTGFLTTNHLALLIKPLQPTQHTTNLLKPSKQLQRLVESIATCNVRQHYIHQTLRSSLEEGLGMRLV